MKYLFEHLESVGRSVPEAAGFEESVLRRLPAAPLPAARWRLPHFRGHRRVSALAAAVLLAASIVTAVLLTAGSSQRAFGQVLQRVEQFEAVRYRAHTTDDATELRTRVRDGRSRTELTPAGGGLRLIAIRNPEALPDATCYLFADKKIVEFEPADLGRDAAARDDPVKELKAMCERRDMKSAPGETYAGRPVRVFVAHESTGGRQTVACRVLVDKATTLPVRIEFDGKVGRMAMDGFEWGVTVDGLTFATDPPAGYAVVYDAMRPLSHGLSAYAKYFDGQLPDAIDAAAVDAWKRAADRRGGDKGARSAWECEMAWGFSVPAFARKHGLDLRYYGRGKRLNWGRPGEVNVVAAVERAPGSGTYEVLMTDGSHAMITRAQLP